MEAFQILFNGLAEAFTTLAQSSVDAVGALMNNSVSLLQEFGVITLAFYNDLIGLIIGFLSA
jgi:hypothetical protein